MKNSRVQLSSEVTALSKIQDVNMNSPYHLAAFAPIELLNSPRPVWILKTDPRSCESTSQLTAEETLSRLVRAQSQLISVFRVYASICMVGHRSLPPRHPYRTSSFTWLFESILITMFSMIGEQRDALRFRQVSREGSRPPAPDQGVPGGASRWVSRSTRQVSSSFAQMKRWL